MANWFDLFGRSAAPSGGAPEYLVVGLGNPGKEYVYTRHNAGFLAMDYMTEKLRLPDLRAFYDIEHLWADADLRNIPNLD